MRGNLGVPEADMMGAFHSASVVKPAPKNMQYYFEFNSYPVGNAYGGHTFTFFLFIVEDWRVKGTPAWAKEIRQEMSGLIFDTFNYIKTECRTRKEGTGKNWKSYMCP